MIMTNWLKNYQSVVPLTQSSKYLISSWHQYNTSRLKSFKLNISVTSTTQTIQYMLTEHIFNILNWYKI